MFAGMGAANRTVSNASFCLLPSFSSASNGAKSAVIGSLLQRTYSTSPSPAAAPLHASPPPANAAPKEEEEVTHFGFKNVRAKEKASMVGEVFHRVASNYDLMNDVMSAGVHRCTCPHYLHFTRICRIAILRSHVVLLFIIYPDIGRTGS
jgi:hypothetical protein